MAGLFGGFRYGNAVLPSDQNPGGILSGMQQQPEWADNLGLMSSALKDAAANFSGREDPGALQAWQQHTQQNQIRQQLMGALNSDDPAIRQQGYAAMNMLGMPTDALQKQQASAQLPAFLASMRPTTQTLAAPGASADLGQIGGAPGGPPAAPGQVALPQLPPMKGNLNIPQGPSLGNFQQPGKSFSDAITDAPPELQSQYAPKMLDLQMAADAEANKPFDLGPGQHRFSGGQDIAHLPDKPITREYQNGGNKITEQSLDGGQTWSQLGKGPAWKPDDETPPDPSTVQYWAQSVAAGQPLPALGMGKQAGQYRQAILKGAAAINSGQGLTGVDQNVNIASTKANSGALGKQTALRSATEGFENTMLQNMNVARDLLKKGAGTTGIPVLNRYQQYIKGQYGGDPDVVALKNAIDTVADENAKIRSGTLGNTPATDAMRTSIHEGLNTSQTPEQILSAFGVMEKDAGNRSRALRAQEAALKRGLTGKNDLPQIPGIREPQAQGASPALPASLPRLPAIQKIRVFNPTTGRLE